MITEVNELVEAFRRRYPSEDGWKVFVNWPRESSGNITCKLPEFLRDVKPEWLRQAPVCTGGTTSFKFYDEDSGLVLGNDKIETKFSIAGWTGEMRLEIDGQPLVLENYIFPFLGEREKSNRVLTLQACKDQAVIQRLFEAAIRWEAAKDDCRSKFYVFGARGGAAERRPKQTWGDVFLPPGMAEDIKNNVDGFFKSGSLYKEIGIPHKRGFLLSGPPGNGKTLTAKILASNRAVSFCWLKLTSGTDDDSVAMAFDHAARHSPCILLIEDLDRISKDNGVTMSNILNQLDGLASREGVLVMATTNAPEKLDPALVHRPSRFDRVWRVPMPSEEQRLALLRSRGGRFFTEPALTRVAADSHGFSMAYTQEVVTNATIQAANAGERPNDEHLHRSLSQIRCQFTKTFAKDGLGNEVDKTPMMGFMQEAKPAPKAAPGVIVY